MNWLALISLLFVWLAKWTSARFKWECIILCAIEGSLRPFLLFDSAFLFCSKWNYRLNKVAKKKLKIHENNYYGGLNTIDYGVHCFWFTQIQCKSWILLTLFLVCLPISSSMRMRVAELDTEFFNRLIELINSNFQLLYRSGDTVTSRIHTFRYIHIYWNYLVIFQLDSIELVRTMKSEL